MQDLMFATLLFVVYFCAVSIFMYNPDKAMPKKPIPVAPGQLELFQNAEPQQNLEDNFFPETKGVTEESLVPIPSQSCGASLLLEANSPKFRTAALDGISFSCSEEAVAVKKQEQEEDVPVEPDYSGRVTPREEVEALEPESISLTVELPTSINLDKLPILTCRRIAGSLSKISEELAIAQKANGTDQRVEFLRAQIKKRLEQAPEVVVPVITDAVEFFKAKKVSKAAS